MFISHRHRTSNRHVVIKNSWFSKMYLTCISRALGCVKLFPPLNAARWAGKKYINLFTLKAFYRRTGNFCCKLHFYAKKNFNLSLSAECQCNLTKCNRLHSAPRKLKSSLWLRRWLRLSLSRRLLYSKQENLYSCNPNTKAITREIMWKSFPFCAVLMALCLEELPKILALVNWIDLKAKCEKCHKRFCREHEFALWINYSASCTHKLGNIGKTSTAYYKAHYEAFQKLVKEIYKAYLKFMNLWNKRARKHENAILICIMTTLWGVSC